MFGHRRKKYGTKTATTAVGEQMPMSKFQFKRQVKLPATSGEHSIDLYTKNPDKNKSYGTDKSTNRDYFAKKGERNLVELEVSVQELIRSMHLENPKGKVGVDTAGFFALSHEVEGFIPLRELLENQGEENVIRRINENEYKDFGRIVVYAICTKEFDLHTRNIGINKNNRFVKIDGDWALARLRLKVDGDRLLSGKFNITTDVIASLPLLPLPQVVITGQHMNNAFDYMVFNHFDQFKEGKLIQKDQQTFINKISSPAVRKDINIALLYFILYPTACLKKIAGHQCSDQRNADTVYLELIMNRLQILKAAAIDSEFNKFIRNLSDADFQQHVEGFAINLSQFKLSGKTKLAPFNEILEKVNQRFELLKNVINEEDFSEKWLNNFESLVDIPPTLSNIYGESPLLLAAEHGDLCLFKLLLKQGADLDDSNTEGYTPLMIAAMNGNTEIVKYILRKKNNDKALVNLSLQMATFGNHTLLAQDLVKNLHADVNVVLQAGITPLLLAIENGNLTLFNLFLVHGAAITVVTEGGMTSALLAAMSGSLSILQKLNILDARLVKTVTVDNESTLLLAAKHGHEHIADFLLNLKCDANRVDTRNRTPLFYAARTATPSLIKKLLAVTDSKHFNHALQAAAESGNLDAVKLLIAAGADINAPAATAQMYTPLMLAARNNHPKVVKYLLADPTFRNIDYTSSDGSTALIKAAQQRSWECIYQILKANKKPNLLHRRHDGASMLSLITEAGEHEFCATIIRDYGISVESANTCLRNSVLHMAIEASDRKALKILFALKPNTAVFNSRGESLLMTAFRCGHAKVIALVLECVKPDEDSIALAYTSAKIHGQTDVVDQALKNYRESNKNRVSIKAQHSIHTAIEESDIESLQLLCANGVGSYVTNHRNETPLTHAARKGSVELMRIILAANPKQINEKDFNEWTPLTIAIKHQQWQMAEFLLEQKGINLSEPGNDGFNAFELAMNANNFSFCALLIKKGYDVNAELDCMTGMAPLHCAVVDRDVDKVKFLLDHHADINKKVGTYKTPLVLALEMNDANMVNTLVERGAIIRPEDKDDVHHLCQQARHLESGTKRTFK